MYADTAPYYDLIHESRGRKAGEEATVVLAEARRRRPSVRSLLDAGCGTGVHLPFFASAVEDVVGFDASARMLEVAGGRAPNAELHQGDFRTFDLGRRFDAIVCLFSGIGYLVDEADLRSAIANFSRHLEPGGVLLVEGWVEPEFWLESTVATEAARADGLAVARAVVRSGRGGGGLSRVGPHVRAAPPHAPRRPIGVPRGPSRRLNAPPQRWRARRTESVR